MGDAQNNIKSTCSRTFRSAYATVPDARFLIHAGDLVNEGYDDRLWEEWCDALGFLSSNVPSLPVVGNHDLHRIPGQGPSGGAYRFSDHVEEKGKAFWEVASKRALEGIVGRDAASRIMLVPLGSLFRIAASVDIFESLWKALYPLVIS